MQLPRRVGRYEVESVLGEGAMGRVLLARDTVLGREVALKILRDDLTLPSAWKAELFERMRQEARAAAAIAHPAIVTLHDMGEDDEVGLYLVFERVVGPTLRERILEGPLPPAEVARIARDIGAALSVAHAAGVVHRDVKPENVMLAAAGPKLTDFGIARLPDSTLTQATTVLSTPAYAAPEALASGTCGAASDQFSLAATLYEALTGERAFAGGDALAVASRVASAQQKPASAVRPALRIFPHVDLILDRALSKEPRRRFASCEAFGAALAAELDTAGALETPVPRLSLATRATRQWQNRAVVVAMLVIAGLVIAGRFQHAGEAGVSLRAVASAFAAAASASHGAGATITRVGGTPSHPPRPLAAGSSAAAGLDAPIATSPSGSAHHALDSAASDAGRDNLAVDARASDPVAPAADAPAQ